MSVVWRPFFHCMAPIRYPEDLPICARRAEIIAALRAHQVVVVAGETGSGKTTQLPKMCLDAGLGVRGRIGCTQPRRVAALSVSKRVAEELGVEQAGTGHGLGGEFQAGGHFAGGIKHLDLASLPNFVDLLKDLQEARAAMAGFRREIGASKKGF